MFGWSRVDYIGRNISTLIPEQLRQEHDAHLAAFEPARTPTHVLGLGEGKWLEALCSDGSRLPVEVSISTFEREGRRYFAGFVRNVSERRATEQRLHHFVTSDQLTGLPNEHSCQEAVTARQRKDEPVTAIVVAMVGVPVVTERHGRIAAETILTTVAARLGETIANDDFLARLDGDGFVVLSSHPQPERLARQLREVARHPIAWRSMNLYPEVKVGMASSRSGAAEVGLLRAALAAANEASPLQERITHFSPELGERITREARVEEQLRQAIAGGGLTMALQPQVGAADGIVKGAESLARWHNPVLGTIPPDEFIPLAERTGVIGDIDAFMLRESLAEAAAWHKERLDLLIAVNVSAVDFRQPNLIPLVAEALAETGLPPSKLELELTESAVADDPERTRAQLFALKDLGISLALDDFGTGYSALSYLRRFPIDALKIDRSFVIDTTQDRDADAVVRAIVALARALGIKTIAEGVETEAQVGFLRELGVDLLQGFYFSRPVDPRRFRTLARQGKG